MRTAPFSKNFPGPLLRACCASTRGTAADAAAAAPAARRVRLFKSIVSCSLNSTRFSQMSASLEDCEQTGTIRVFGETEHHARHAVAGPALRVALGRTLAGSFGDRDWNDGARHRREYRALQHLQRTGAED